MSGHGKQAVLFQALAQETMAGFSKDTLKTQDIE